uniref:EF-hand domain-containing protein n=1 Tax=Alexandrium monilatum TaxID=311494 RepID=A0A7S4Q6W2_9DINO
MGGGLSTACTVRQRRGRWLLCVDDDQKAHFERAVCAVGPDRIEELLQELFRLHDLNKNGALEESELIKINEKIQILHYGEDIDKEEVRRKYKEHFRDKLDAQGHPVSYDVFRAYWLHVLQEHDKDLRVHEMILEQCIAEVDSARQAFFIKAFQSKSDEQFLPTLSCHSGVPPTALASSRPSSGVGPGTPAWPRTPVAADDEVGSVGPGTCQSFRSEFLPKPARDELGNASSSRPCMDSFSSDFVPSPANLRPSPASAVETGTATSLESDFVPRPMDDGATVDTYMSLDSDFVPSPSLAELRSSPRPGAPSWVSTAALGSSLAPAPPWSSGALPGGSLAAPASSCGAPSRGYARGEHVEVWSNSKSAWLNAVVQESFPVRSFAEGFTVPAGTVKVSFDSGVKWIMPEQVGNLLRRSRVPSSQCSTAPSQFTKGSAVQVWSDSRKAWLDGSVEEAFAEDSQAGGFSVSAGTVKVRSAAGIKWVRPEQVSQILRETSPDAQGQLPPGPARRADQRAVSIPAFSKGEKIQVWSDSRQLWLGGVVLEVFPTAAMADGFWVPAGSLKVSSDAGVKWVSPVLSAKVLRKVDLSGSVATPDLKAVLAETLQDPDRLQRHVSAVWAAAGCGSKGLPRDRAAWALEGLAMQFDVQLELEGRHLSGLQRRLDAHDGDGDGYLAQVEFQRLSREIVGEVVGSL